MNRFKIKILSFVVFAYAMGACLDADDSNFPTEGNGSPLVLMSWNPDGGTTLNSGLNFFGAQALTYPPTDEADTTEFTVTVQGGPRVDKDIDFTLQVDEDALLDNFSKDSIEYLLMPDSTYDFLNTTATVEAGKRAATFQVVFYPSKIDPTQNYALPVTAVPSNGIATSANYGKLYFHVIGNPIAGLYTWDFIRCSTPDCSGGPDGQTVYGRSTLFSPVNPTTVQVKTGYYTQPNYIIKFKNDDGVLSDFTVAIDPKEIEDVWTPAGIVVTSGPTILVEDNNTKFTVKYTTATRNVTDIYYK